MTRTERLALSKQASDARLRASLARLEQVARARLERGGAALTRTTRTMSTTVSDTGRGLLRDLMAAEVLVLVALAFGVGVLLGRR